MKHDARRPVERRSAGPMPAGKSIKSRRYLSNGRISDRKQDNRGVSQLANTEFTQTDRPPAADESHSPAGRAQPSRHDKADGNAGASQQPPECLSQASRSDEGDAALTGVGASCAPAHRPIA